MFHSASANPSVVLQLFSCYKACMAIIVIPTPLRDKLGGEAADALVEVLNEVTKNSHAGTLTFVEEKFERRLSEELGQVNQHLVVGEERIENRITLLEERIERRLSEEIGRVNQRITEEIGRVNQRITEETSRLEQKISASQANLIKWMFIFWVGQIAVMSGILFAMLKLLVA